VNKTGIRNNNKQKKKYPNEGEIFVILFSKRNKGLVIGGARLHFKRCFVLIWKTQRTEAKYLGHFEFYKIHIEFVPYKLVRVQIYFNKIL